MWNDSFFEWKKKQEKKDPVDKLDSLVEALRKAGECKADAMTLGLDDRNESLVNGLLEERDELIREAMWLYAELHSKLERSGDDAGVELE